MASVAMSSSLAARHAVAPNAALVSAQRRSASESSGRRLAARRGPARVRAQDDGIPDTAGPGGFSGSRLIVPGMEGFDPSYGDPSRNRPPSIPSPSNPGGGRPAGPPGSVGSNMPGQFPGGYEAPPKPGSERKAGEAFAPFRPPSEYLDQGDFAAEDDNMSLLRLRQRAGNWFDLAPLFPKLMRSGMTPDDIFDETGIEPREQSLWATWVASRGSLVADPRFPDEKLSYFDQEWNAENLSHIQYLSSDLRASFAEFVVDNEFNPDQTKELVKSVEIRNAHDSQAKGFGRGPGECLAFKMWRDIQEVQRYQGIETVMELVDKGKRYAENESTMERLDALASMWQMDVAEGSEQELEQAKSSIQVVRLDKDELAFRPIPMLGALERLTANAVIAVQPIAPRGVFSAFVPEGAKEWVALPAWAARTPNRACPLPCSSITPEPFAAPAISPRERNPRCSSSTRVRKPRSPVTITSQCARESSIQLAGVRARRSSTCSRERDYGDGARRIVHRHRPSGARRARAGRHDGRDDHGVRRVNRQNDTRRAE